MKKIFAIALVLICILVLVGCASNHKPFEIEDAEQIIVTPETIGNNINITYDDFNSYEFYQHRIDARYVVILLLFAIAFVVGYLVFRKDKIAPTKKWVTVKKILNIAIFVSIGALFGHVLWVFVDYKIHPEIYAANSAPWYTTILVALAFWGIVILIEAAVLLFVCHKLSQGPVIGIIERKTNQTED